MHYYYLFYFFCQGAMLRQCTTCKSVFMSFALMICESKQHLIHREMFAYLAPNQQGLPLLMGLGKNTPFARCR